MIVLKSDTLCSACDIHYPLGVADDRFLVVRFLCKRSRIRLRKRSPEGFSDWTIGVWIGGRRLCVVNREADAALDGDVKKAPAS